MSTVTVTGYYDDGIAYAAVLDDTQKDPLSGVLAIAPTALITEVGAATGQKATLHPTGTTYDITLDTIEGVLAYLVNRTQIVKMDGDLPEDLVGTPDDRIYAVQ